MKPNEYIKLLEQVYSECFPWYEKVERAIKISEMYTEPTPAVQECLSLRTLLLTREG